MAMQVDAQAVIRILSGKISLLTLESAMLQAQVMELEAQLREMAEAGKADMGSGEVEK